MIRVILDAPRHHGTEAKQYDLLITLLGNRLVGATKTHLQDQETVKETQPFLLSVTIFITPKCNLECLLQFAEVDSFGRCFNHQSQNEPSVSGKTCAILFISFTNHALPENTYFIYRKHTME